jgi:hypothetical protein
MPSTSVYLVLPSRIAWMAACLDVFGRVEVRLAGTQADHVAASRFQLAGLGVTAMVADGLTRARASDWRGAADWSVDIGESRNRKGEEAAGFFTQMKPS